MKYFFITLFCLPFLCQAQSDFYGQWKSSLMGIDLYIAIDDAPSVSLTIPLQGISKEKANNVEILSNKIDFFFSKFSATFYGKLQNDTIKGTWKQSGKEFPLTFTKNSDNVELKRPQEPKAPFSYISEDVTYISAEDESEILMAGTLTKPEGDGPFPAIILISGSGPQTRDSDLLKHKPFFVLADYFTKKGYAVLRYDDRGVNKSKGKFKGATSYDLSQDAEGALNYLLSRNDINHDAIGFMGHSEGGMIAPMVAARNKNVDFLVLLAGPGIPIQDLMKYQLVRSYKKAGINKDAVAKAEVFVNKLITLLMQEETNDKIIDEFQSLVNTFYNSLSEVDQKKFGESQEMMYFSLAPSFLDPWMRYFLRYDPHENLSKIHDIPVLALNGKKDVQVTAKENIKGIKKSLKAAKNKQVTTKYFKDKNHLFQTAITGEGDEYALIEETFSPEVMMYIENWLAKNIK